MNAPATSVQWLVQHFDEKCFVTQEQSERYWEQEESAPVSVFDFYSKQMLRHYLGKKREHGEEWVLLYSAGLSLISMSKIIEAKKESWCKDGESRALDGIDMDYLRVKEYDHVSMDFAVSRGYMLICMTPAMLGESLVKMRNRKQLIRERLKRIRPAEPSCFVEALILFAKLHQQYFLHQKENGLFLEHVFFDKKVDSAPLRMVGVSERWRPHVYRFVENADHVDERTGICYRKLPRRHLRRKTE